MTFDDALQVLGIDGTASRKAARRAYLKLVKVHKPDRDPEGFQRVRAAFELIDQQIEWRQAWDLSAEDAAGADDDSPLADPAPPEAVAPNGAPDDSHEIDAPPPPDLLPLDPLPVDALLFEDPADHAPALTPEECPQTLMGQAYAAARAGDAERAEADAMRAFALAREALGAAPPTAYDALHVCLLLYAQGHPAAARTVGAAFAQWLRDSGVEREVMGTWMAGRLAVVHSLLALPETVHPEPLDIIASGMLDEDFDIPQALVTFAQDKPFASIDLREAMEQHAPNLAEAWGDALRRGEESSPHSPHVTRPPRRAPFWSRRRERVFDDSDELMGKVQWFGVLVALLIWNTTTCDSGPWKSAQDRAADRAAMVKRLQESGGRWRHAAKPAPKTAGPATTAAPASLPPIDLSEAPDWLTTFCEKLDAKCNRAHAVWAAFLKGKCAQAKQRYAWMSTDMMLSPARRKALKAGGRVIQSRCRGP